MKNCIGIINLDEKESRLGELVRRRTLASVPIAGRYRVIDFVLSNMTNSGIESIGIFTKNKSRSLIDHLTNGRPWDLHRKKDGLRVFNFGNDDLSYDDVHNFAENIEFLKYSNKEYVLLAPSYMICNINYKEVIKYHKKSKNDVTVVYGNTTEAHKKFIDCDVLNIDENNKVISIGENIGKSTEANISMEMYVLRTDLFIDIVHECIKNGMCKKIKNYISSNLLDLNVGAYKFDGYLSCINSIEAYYAANMGLLNEEVNKELFYNTNSPVYTKSKDEGPTKYTESSNISNSIIANGSYIEGEVKNCIIGRRVHIGVGTKLENCVIMQGVVIGDGVEMDTVIADKGTVVKNKEKIFGIKNNPVTIYKNRQV